MLYFEPGREIEIVRQTDVIVCGGGPAGVAAALVAARAGARTQLIDVQGCLGGVWTAGLLSWILDAGNKTGIMAEIIARLEARGAEIPARVPHNFEPADVQGKGVQYNTRQDFAYDPELMKIVLEEMCLEAGVQVRLHTRVVATAQDDSGRLRYILTESKSGREAWQAEAFVDATGDGDVAALAGCGFDLGNPETGESQPMSLIMLVTGLALEQVMPYTHPKDGSGSLPAKLALREEIQRGGVDPSYAKPTLFHIRDDLFAIMANHEYGVSALDADQISAATLRARAELHRIVDGLRALGGVWQQMKIVATNAQIGIREGRRIHGRYTVNAGDIFAGVQHDDAVCRVTFPVDVHTTNAARGKGTEVAQVQQYDIPLRALIARDIDGLLLAGRCISGDFIAHASYRVTGNAVAMGQAAGAVAALAAQTTRQPHEIGWPEVRDVLARVTSLKAETA